MKRIVTQTLRAGMLLGMLLAISSPLPALAADAYDTPTGPGHSQSLPSQAVEPSARLADIDNNGISDNLQAKMVGVAASEKFDVVVTFKGKGLGDATTAQAAVGAFTVKREFTIVSGFAATMTAGQIRALSKVLGVFRIEEDFQVKAYMADARPDGGVNRVQSGPDAILVGSGVADGAGSTICIIDTGIEAGHEQFADKSIVFEDLVSRQTLPYDDSEVCIFGVPVEYIGHGTHVSAIAAGVGGSGANSSIKGTAPGADIVSVKALDICGGGTESMIVQAIQYCAGLPEVDIISMSLGGDAGSDGQDAMSQAVNAAVSAGKIVVVAAGNTGPGPGTITSPGAAEFAITVNAAGNWSGDGGGYRLAAFSARGPVPGASYTKPDVVAPGMTISSALGKTTNQYHLLDGTSMATPYVAGIIAMGLQVNSELPVVNQLDPAGFKALLKSTSRDMGAAGEDDNWGMGFIDAYSFVAKAKNVAATPSATPLPTTSLLLGSVIENGEWFSDPFLITAAQVSDNIPVAVVVSILGGAANGLQGAWLPDLDAYLVNDTNSNLFPVGAGEINFSECIGFGGEFCGVGRQETLRFTPTAPMVGSSYRIRVFGFAGSGSFTVEHTHGPLVNTTTPPGIVSVPNVLNQTQAAAAAAITAATLIVGTITQEFSDTVGDGLVISQAPTGGSTVSTGSPVDLTISKGPALVIVPDVVNMTEAAATTAIENAFLIVGSVTTAPHATIPSGSVSDQNPLTGVQMSSGSAVNLTVSTGPGPDANGPPVAVAQTVVTDQDVPIIITLAASDPDGDPVTFSLPSLTMFGGLSGNLPGLTYTPNPGYSGSDSFNFTANDGKGGADTATVSITVNPGAANTAPQVIAFAGATIDEGGTYAQAGSFTDPNTDIWTATVNYSDGGGVEPLSLNPDKSFSLGHTYANQGTYTVTVVVSDGTSSGQNTAQVTVNAPPVGIGSIKGTVWVGAVGSTRLQGAFVELDTSETATTKKRGTFNFNNISAGNRSVTVTAGGCTTQIVAVTVTNGATTSPDIVMACP